MTRPAVMEHITLTSGGTRMSRRAEVSADIIAEVARRIAEDGELWAGWSVKIAPVISNATGGVQGDAGGWIFDAWHSGLRVLRCWLCRLPAASDPLWEAASGQPVDAGVVLHRPRGAPWLAVWLDPDSMPALLLRPAVLIEADDMERCVAWALLDSKP